MARLKLKTLTEQMFYVLLCLEKECCGTEILLRIEEVTEGRVTIGSGTLYNLLEEFLSCNMIAQSRAEGRKRYYVLTPKGKECLYQEYARICEQIADFERIFGKDDHDEKDNPVCVYRTVSGRQTQQNVAGNGEAGVESVKNLWSPLGVLGAKES